MSMGQVCLIVLAVVVGLAMILYLSCLLLFRTGTETAFHFAEPELTLKPSSNPTVMAMCAMLAMLVPLAAILCRRFTSEAEMV